jgi:GMP synthase PP-ATPase subunit
VEPLRDLTKGQLRELDEEVGLLGEVMEGEPTLVVGTVPVGPHA